MDLKLKGKTALVTGGSEGIGKGIALLLAKEGVDVAICARRKEPLEATAKEIAKATGRKIVAIPADLRKDTDAKAFIDAAHKALGRIDIMINNAGSAAGGGTGIVDHDVDAAERLVGGVDEGFGVGVLAQVGRDGDDLAPRRLGDFLGSSLERLFAARADGDIDAFLGQQKRDALADAFAAAGDQRGLAFELEVHRDSSRYGFL